MYSKEQRINLLQVDESDICSSCLLTYDFAHGIKTSITYVSDFISVSSYLKEISRSRIFGYRQFHPETVEFAPRPKSIEVASASRQ